MLDSQQCPSLHVLQPQVKSFGSTSIASHPNRWNLPKKSSSPSRYTNIHSEDEYITSFSINVIGWLELSSNKIKNKQINKKLRQTLISCKLRESLKRKRRYLMFTVKNTRQRESPTKKKLKTKRIAERILQDCRLMKSSPIYLINPNPPTYWAAEYDSQRPVKHNSTTISHWKEVFPVHRILVAEIQQYSKEY